MDLSQDSSNDQCCGAELDRSDPLSLNLNLANREFDMIVVTPRKGEQSMLNHKSKEALDHPEQSQSGFSLNVAKIR